MAKMSIGSILGCVIQHAAVGIFVSIFVVSALNMSRGFSKDKLEVEESRKRVGEEQEEIDRTKSGRKVSDFLEASEHSRGDTRKEIMDGLTDGRTDGRTDGWTDSPDDESDIKQGSDDSYCMVSPEEEMDTRISDTSSVEQRSEEGLSLPASHEVEPGVSACKVNSFRSSKIGRQTDREGIIVQSTPSESRTASNAISATSAPENTLSIEASWVTAISSGSSGLLSPQSTRVDPFSYSGHTTSGTQRAGSPVDKLQNFPRSKSASLGGKTVGSNNKRRSSISLSGVSASPKEGADCNDDNVVTQRHLFSRSFDTSDSPIQTCQESTKNEAELPSYHQLAAPRQESDRLGNQDGTASSGDSPKGWIEEDALARALESQSAGAGSGSSADPSKEVENSMDDKETMQGENQTESTAQILEPNKSEWTNACHWCGAIRPEDCCGLHPEAMAAANQAENEKVEKAKSRRAKGLKGLPIWWQSLNFLASQKRIRGGQERK